MASMTLNDLPAEIILHILTPIQTRSLLPLTLISRRFHSLVLRIFHHRLNIATALSNGDRTLLLEAYHPAARLTEPPLPCTYLGTDGLMPHYAGNEFADYDENIDSSQHPSQKDPAAALAHYNNLYSRYRPHRRIEDPASSKSRVKHPAGDIPGSRTHPATAASSFADSSPLNDPFPRRQDDGEELVRQLVHIDAEMLFTQLQVVTTLVKVGPRSGLFLTAVPVADGVLRVFRNWLRDMCAETNAGPSAKSIDVLPGNSANDQKAKQKSPDIQIDLLEKKTSQQWDRGILWVNNSPCSQDVGIKFRVKQRQWRRDAPILWKSEDEVAVSYEIQYEEVLIRTRHLLLMTEQSLLEQASISRKAIVFGSWSAEMS